MSQSQLPLTPKNLDQLSKKELVKMLYIQNLSDRKTTTHKKFKLSRETGSKTSSKLPSTVILKNNKRPNTLKILQELTKKEIFRRVSINQVCK